MYIFHKQFSLKKYEGSCYSITVASVSYEKNSQEKNAAGVETTSDLLKNKLFKNEQGFLGLKLELRNFIRPTAT